MPMVRPAGPPEPRSHARVARTESLKSERSDKRVSFNKDVGVKHIPRGAKPQPPRNNVVVRPPAPDEWATCTPVKHEPVALSSQELEQQAQDLVRLLDHVNCDSANPFTQSLDRPRNKNNKNLAHHTYNNVIVNNVRNNNNKNINVLNGDPRGAPRSLPTSRTANPIPRRTKGDVNRTAPAHTLPNGGPLAHRHYSVDNLPDSDLDSPPLSRRHPLAGHKSVPDLNTVYYDNTDARGYKFRDPVISYQSTDAIHDQDNLKLNRPNNAGYKSVDNLAEVRNGPGRLTGFKSVGDLPSTTLSDTDSMDATRPQPYKPKVGNIIKKFNAEAEDSRRTNVVVEADIMDVSPRGTLEPDRFRQHNNNQPFSYTGTLPLTSVQAVRRLSPTRELTRPSPPRDSPPRETPVYAQVNKRVERESRSLSNGRDVERNYRNARQDREYSAKIIITDDQYEDYHDASRKNHYTEDDDAYESYQVPEDNMRRLLHAEEMLDEYKEHSNNNINMSSVGVQTDALPKAPSRGRKMHKSPSPSPTRPPQQKQYQVKQQAVKQQTVKQQAVKQQTVKQQAVKHDQKHVQSSVGVQADHYVKKRHHRGENIHNNLASATLVRQVNHGFGRTDRSPSPPMRRPQRTQVRKNVVPLLSDTSDSEAEHRRRTVDPLARIRDQVMQREKLQEEEEEEEAGRGGRLVMKDTNVAPYRSEEMMPLTIDEVDALSLIMEDTGKKSLVVSNHATSVTRTSNHRSRRSEAVTERIHSHKDSLPRPQKPPREKNLALREATPTRGHREATPTRTHREATPTRGHREATPTRAHRESTPTRGQRTATPSRGHREATPTRGHREATPTRGRDTPSRKDPPTMERTKKNNLEKERAAKATKQQKEEKTEKKEKKKKRIKIKFFYDPRPQDDPEEDPLARFTEFRGTSSDERTSPREEDRRERRDDTRHRRSLPDVLEDTANDRRGSREQLSQSREKLSKSREQLSKSRERLDKSRDRLDRSHERLDRSRERVDTTPREVRRGSREGRDVKPREMAVDVSSYSTNRRDSKDSRDSRDNRTRETRSRSRDNLAYNESPDERRPDNDDDKHSDGEYDDDDERGSPDGRPGRSLSDKYRTGQLYDPPAPEAAPPAELPHTEEDEKQEKILRQRKKFFSVLMSDGRNKNNKNKKAEAKVKEPEKTMTLKPSKKSPAPQPTGPPPPQPEKAKMQGQPMWFNRDREEPIAERSEHGQWESSTLNRAELRARKDQRVESGFSTVQRPSARKYSAESSASSSAPPPPRVARTTSFKQRYFGDTDIESSHGGQPGVPDYRSLPNRASRSAHRNVGKPKRGTSGGRGMSPPTGVTGSAGSSLQSSESEVDSHGGSHASRASKASRVSTGSNRSVYLHATAVADIPVRRGSEDTPSERSVNRQTKKVSRSFSLLAPWKPRHYREKYEVEYDNKEAREVNNGKGALPPRPPRRPVNNTVDNKKVNRSQSMYKDSRLAGWLRRRRNKEAKGI